MTCDPVSEFVCKFKNIAAAPGIQLFDVSAFFRYGFDAEASRWRSAAMTASMSRSRI